MFLLLNHRLSSRLFHSVFQLMYSTLNEIIHEMWDFLCWFSFFSPVCKGAKADIVFLTDASWSIGDDNFNKVVKFIFNTVGAFDEISPAGIQVSVLYQMGNDLYYLANLLELLFISSDIFNITYVWTFTICYFLYMCNFGNELEINKGFSGYSL